MKLYIQILVGVFLIGIVGADLGINNPNLPKIERETVGITNINATVYNTNSSNFWDALDTPSDISGSEFWYNSTGTGEFAYNETWFARSSTLTVCANNSKDKTNCDYVCDGDSDEVEIRDAISNLSESGGTIQLSDGFFVFSTELSIDKSNLMLRGHKEATLIYFNQVGGASDLDSGIEITSGHSFVHILDLSAQCTSAPTVAMGWVRGIGISAGEGDEGHQFSGLHVDNCTAGIYSYGHAREDIKRVVIKDNYITNALQTGIESIRGNNVFVTNNVIENSAQFGIWGTGTSTIISNNEISDTGGGGTSNENGIYGNGLSNSQILNNIVSNSSNSADILIFNYNNIVSGNNAANITFYSTSYNNTAFGNRGKVYDNGINNTIFGSALSFDFKTSSGEEIKIMPEGVLTMILEPQNNTFLVDTIIADNKGIVDNRTKNKIVFNEIGEMVG